MAFSVLGSFLKVIRPKPGMYGTPSQATQRAQKIGGNATLISDEYGVQFVRDGMLPNILRNFSALYGGPQGPTLTFGDAEWGVARANPTVVFEPYASGGLMSRTVAISHIYAYGGDPETEWATDPLYLKMCVGKSDEIAPFTGANYTYRLPVPRGPALASLVPDWQNPIMPYYTGAFEANGICFRAENEAGDAADCTFLYRRIQVLAPLIVP